MSYDVDALRAKEFPWAARGERIYLDHAATGPLPQRARDVQAEANLNRAEMWRVGFEYFWDGVVQGREHAARLLNASPEEIAITTNTSQGVNLAARALPFKAGDVVISSAGEFPANIYPWMGLEKAKGVVLELVPMKDRLPDEDALIAALDRPRVRALTVSWVSFATGAKLDLARLGAACKARGIWFVVDAIQGLGPAAMDVKACQIDILATGAQKWLLSPWGTGFAYVRRDLIPELDPPAVGWLSMPASADFTRFLDYDYAFYPDARKFEVFTAPMHDLKAMAASLGLFLELGPAAVEAHVASLADHVVTWCNSRADVRLITPVDRARRAGLLSIAVDDLAAASERLNAARVSHSVREGGIRLSPNLYNTTAELDIALAALAPR
ncbi:MAG: aminotransferase class V-fold PLP-dependent enzyme [Gemmatimonadetes bacterium]|nr:aminotransferase class V-fold PLP-dependent enzyme [Gemmatimonadota bacterium]